MKYCVLAKRNKQYFCNDLLIKMSLSNKQNVAVVVIVIVVVVVVVEVEVVVVVVEVEQPLVVVTDVFTISLHKPPPRQNSISELKWR